MWQVIKQILEQNKGTCIIVEEGVPKFVVVDFLDYQKLINKKTDNPSFKEEQFVEKANQDIEDWKSKEEVKENIDLLSSEIQSPEDIKIEDLPFH